MRTNLSWGQEMMWLMHTLKSSSQDIGVEMSPGPAEMCVQVSVRRPLSSSIEQTTNHLESEQFSWKSPDLEYVLLWFLLGTEAKLGSRRL